MNDLPKAGNGNKLDYPIIRLIERKDLERLLTLVDEVKPSIGGSRNPSMYKALCREALSDRRVVIVVAEEESEIMGFFLAVIDRNRWRESFAFRHPATMLKLMWDRALGRARKRSGHGQTMSKAMEEGMQVIRSSVNADTTKSWKDSSPQIAKLLFLGVREKDKKKKRGGGAVRIDDQRVGPAWREEG